MKRNFAFLLFFLLAISCSETSEPERTSLIYSSETFTLTADSVREADFYAVAISDKEIISSYSTEPRELAFKFCIKTSDDELPAMVNHEVVLYPENGVVELPTIKFGERLVMPAQEGKTPYLEMNTKVKIKVDINDILKDFEKNGNYKGNITLLKEEFAGLYIIGSRSPLTWNLDNAKASPLQMTDNNGDGIYEIEFILNEADALSNQRVRKIQADILAYPQFTSDFKIVNALYNLSLEELEQLVVEDVWDTGEKWGGVWTRDVSYSILLSLAYIAPERAKAALMRKVNNGKIIQDTGTGGSWPISSDRMTWVPAAYEVYKVTGDREWLKTIYSITKKSCEADFNTVFSPDSLVLGESSFLDWREQSYPLWMNPVDIYRSECLGTNAIHYRTYEIIAEISEILGEPSEKYRTIAQQIKNAMNQHLWQADKGYYAQFRYGRAFMSSSPKPEHLGEALSVLFQIADNEQSKQIITSTPVLNFGTPCFYPQIPDMQPYHNNGIWPFVQGYWNWASAKTANEKALTHGLAALYRASAFFLTNKENFVAQNGSSGGTAVNSDRQLWSVAANIAMVYRVFAGMDFKEDGIYFSPTIPKAFSGNIIIRSFRYRKATLNISISGFGNEIEKFMIDGVETENYLLPAATTGEHKIDIILKNNLFDQQNFLLVENKFAPKTPVVELNGNTLRWQKVDNAVEYQIFKNGIFHISTKETIFNCNSANYTEYQVKSIDAEGLESFLSEPIALISQNDIFTFETDLLTRPPQNIKNYNGKGYTILSKEENNKFEIKVTIPTAGNYLLTAIYANGSGPLNTENKCAIRNIYVNNKRVGVLVMPQIEKDNWSVWQESNLIPLTLSAGEQTFVIQLDTENENMNNEINTAFLDRIVLRKL